MKKIILISPYSEIVSFGLRSISAFLKAGGVQTSIIFAPLESKASNWIAKKTAAVYSNQVIDDIAGLARDADLIGISLMSNYYITAADLTRRLRQKLPHTPILWGGIHPTVSPEDSLTLADLICVGEGQETLWELTQAAGRKDWKTIAGLWFNEQGKVVRTPYRTLLADIDRLPFPDYEIETHYILEGGRIKPLDSSLMKKYLGLAYYTMFTLNCPFSCAYCCNNALHKIDRRYRVIRKHSVDYIIEEIKSILDRFPYIKTIKFNDDAFMSLRLEEMELFTGKFKELGGNLNFVITGINPNMVTKEKLECLIAAGLKRVRLGVQSGSRNTLQLYNRKQDLDRIVEVSGWLAEHKNELVIPSYDIILDNPWETTADRKETLQLLARLKRPVLLNIYSLTLYPGTALYKKAQAEGLVNDNLKVYAKNYFDVSPTYLNLLTSCYGLFRIPPGWLAKLTNNKLADKNPHLPRVFFFLVSFLILIKRVISHLKNNDLSYIPYPIASLWSKLRTKR